MKVLRLHKTADLRLHEEPVPIPTEGEELLRVTAVGICGSDLHWFDEGGIGDATLDRPLVLGHEFAAMIAAGEREGERVAVDPAIPCWACRFCREGNPNLCSSLRFAGHGMEDGALRTYMTWPASRLHSISDSLSDEAGAMLEPLGVAIHATDLGKIGKGSRIGVFGCGPIGLLIQQVAAVENAYVAVAVDPLPHRRAAASAFGARITLNPNEPDFRAALSDACSPDGLDVSFEASNDYRAIQAAVDAARPGGRIVITGIPSGNRIELDAASVRRKGLTLLLTRRMREMYGRAIPLADNGLVELDGLVSDRFQLEDFETAFETAVARTGHKVVVNP